jgi:hypothetical protein
MTSQGSDPLVRKKIKRNDDDSSEAQQAQSKNADRACSKRACMRLDGRKLEINGRIIRLGSKESVFVKLLFEKINTYVPTDDLYVAVYGGKAGDWYKDSKEEKQCIYSLLRILFLDIQTDSAGTNHFVLIWSAFNFFSRTRRTLPGHNKIRKHISFRRLTFKAIFGKLPT